jgi:hypothetical protein
MPIRAAAERTAYFFIVASIQRLQKPIHTNGWDGPQFMESLREIAAMVDGTGAAKALSEHDEMSLIRS